MTRTEITAIIILLMIAVIRFLFFVPDKPDYGNFIHKNVSFLGMVSDDPDVRLNTKHLNIKIENSDVNILVFTERARDIKYGDKVSVSGILSEPENFITNSGKEFNYKRYLANQNIYFLIKKPDIKIISHNNGHKIKTILFSIKNSLIKKINQIIPPPQSDLASGLILGVRGGFDEDLKQNFIDTGTIHIVALSGYNVSIIAKNIMDFFKLFFSGAISTVLGIISIILFVILTGASSTALRAGIMAIIMLLGKLSGRNYLAFRTLIIAGLLMFAYNPMVITDMSFQLSFLATAGVLLITPLVINWFKFIPMKFGLRELFSTTIGAMISVLPVILYSTGIFSLVSPFANILIIPVIPPTMLFVFLTGVLNFISPVIAVPFGLVSNFLLQYILFIVEKFSDFILSSITFFYFPLFFTILIYILLIIWIIRKNKK